MLLRMALLTFLDTRTEEDFAWVFRPRRQQDHSQASLRLTECSSIDYPVSPPVTHVLQILDEVQHCLAAVELQHERHVLEHEPPRTLLLAQESEDVIDKARPVARDPCSETGLREVLAREAG